MEEKKYLYMKDKFGICIKCLLIYKAKMIYNTWAKFDNSVHGYFNAKPSKRNGW